MSRYPFPWTIFLGLARDLPTGRRSIARDAVDMTRRIEPKPCVSGTECVPPRGPVAIAANHFQRRGLWIAWPGAVITVALWERRRQDPPVHWLVTGGLRLFQWRRSGPEIIPLRFLFEAVARTYGMAPLPLSGASRRGSILRRWVEWAGNGEAIGIFPEGLSGTSESLRQPERGFDSICALLRRRGVAIVPCGIWEQDERLHVTFGPSIGPEAAGSDAVMCAIAALLPEGQRGDYALETYDEAPLFEFPVLMQAGNRARVRDHGALE